MLRIIYKMSPTKSDVESPTFSNESLCILIYISVISTYGHVEDNGDDRTRHA